MKNINTNATTKALTIKKENSLAIVKNVSLTVVRVSSKALLACISLTLLNLLI